MKENFNIPKEIIVITDKLEQAGFEAYLVGGCTRDLIRGEKPKDWDITTNAKPEEILGLFGDDEAFYENDFGTVTVKNESVKDPTLHNVEITPYRLESKYSNFRHPDDVTFGDKLEDDLKRRDFTMNAIAYLPASGRSLSKNKGQPIDPFGGIKDIKDKIIRAVGDAHERFGEDALRIIRAIRFSAELGFTISHETSGAILDSADLLKNIAVERIQAEFNRLLMSKEPAMGIAVAQKLGVWKHIIPELEAGIDCEQNGDHIYDVWEHSLRAVQHSAEKDWPLHVRLAALLHDVGKPPTRKWSEEKKDWTFYGHDVVGAKITKKILGWLKYSRDIVNTVGLLVRNHLFFTDIDKITLSAVRRIVANVGPENVWDLMKVRACDRIGMGRPKEKPYRLRKYESMIEEAMRSPVSVEMLKIEGKKIMEVTRETPGPRIGHILHALLDEILEKPENNVSEWLEAKTLELSKLPEKELEKRGSKGRESRKEAEEAELSEIRKKYGVK